MSAYAVGQPVEFCVAEFGGDPSWRQGTIRHAWTDEHGQQRYDVERVPGVRFLGCHEVSLREREA